MNKEKPSNKGETKSEGTPKKSQPLKKCNFKVQPLNPEDDPFVYQTTGLDSKTVKKIRASMHA